MDRASSNIAILPLVSPTLEMGQEALLCRLKRQFVHTTDSHHRYQTYPNFFLTKDLTAPEQAWVADVTYIRLPKMFVYLA